MAALAAAMSIQGPRRVVVDLHHGLQGGGSVWRLAERTGLRPSFDQHRVAPADAHGGEAIASNAQDAGRRIWKDGYRYAKAGLVTTDLVTLAHL
jgi:hypothetical protein